MVQCGVQKYFFKGGKHSLLMELTYIIYVLPATRSRVYGERIRMVV